jgi:hypothetical protein
VIEPAVTAIQVVLAPIAEFHASRVNLTTFFVLRFLEQCAATAGMADPSKLRNSVGLALQREELRYHVYTGLVMQMLGDLEFPQDDRRLPYERLSDVPSKQSS